MRIGLPTIATLTNKFLSFYDVRSPRILKTSLDSPARKFIEGDKIYSPIFVLQSDFKSTVKQVALSCRESGRIPSEIWIGSKKISPEDYLATLASIVVRWDFPKEVKIIKGNFTADKYVADDDPKIFNWVIHPEGFHAPKIMELAKLQAWTLKPAVMKK